MADFNVNQITNKIGDQGPTIAGVTTVSSTGNACSDSHGGIG